MKTETKMIKESNMTCGSIATVEANESQQTGHTPGPWKWDSQSNTFNRDHNDVAHPLCCVYGNQDKDGYGDTIATVTTFFDYGRRISKEEYVANARLIAAAPELLGICQEIANSKCDLGDSERRIRLYAAITKAGAKL